MDNLTPNIFVYDLNATTVFYKILGFETVMTVPEKEPYEWVMMRSGEVTLMFQTFSSLGNQHPEISRSNGGSLLFYVKVKKIRDFLEKIRGNVRLISDLNKTFYGATEFSIADNNGYVLTFAEDEA